MLYITYADQFNTCFKVHKAVLRSTNETVAVKLLCPGIEEKFRADIKTLRNFCKLAMPQHVTAFDEIEKQFCSEFDYFEEASNLNLVRSKIMPKWHKYIEIPEPVLPLCSKHVLVMQYLEGKIQIMLQKRKFLTYFP